MILEKRKTGFVPRVLGRGGLHLVCIRTKVYCRSGLTLPGFWGGLKL